MSNGTAGRETLDIPILACFQPATAISEVGCCVADAQVNFPQSPLFRIQAPRGVGFEDTADLIADAAETCHLSSDN